MEEKNITVGSIYTVIAEFLLLTGYINMVLGYFFYLFSSVLGLTDDMSQEQKFVNMIIKSILLVGMVVTSGLILIYNELYKKRSAK